MKILKGEIMGIEKLSFGRDYAAEFETKTNAQQAYNQGKIDALKGTTVPIAQAPKNEDMGLTVERQAAQEEEKPAEQLAEQPVVQTEQDNVEAQTIEQRIADIPVTVQQERTLDDKNNFKAAVNEMKEKIEAAGTKFETGRVTVYTDKKEYKAAEKQYKADLKAKKQEYLNQGFDKKVAEQKAKEDIPEVRHRSSEKLAEDIIKNDRYKQRFETTTVFMDKDAYGKAQADNEKKHKELTAKYVNDGMDEKDAKARASRELPLNAYVKNKNTRRYVETKENADGSKTFYDENGNFSSDKFKREALYSANLHTGKDEEINYNLSLKERREETEANNADPNKKIEIKNDVVSDMANISNLGWEVDHTRVYRGAAIGGGIVTGAAVGALLSPTVGATALAESVAVGTTTGTTVGAAATAVAAVEVSTDLTVAGAATGGALGTAGSQFLIDKGGKEAVIPKLDKPQEPPVQPVEPAPVEPVEPTPVQPAPVEPTPVQPTPVEPEPTPVEPVPVEPEPVEPEPCTVIVQNNESLSKLSKKYGVPIDTIIELNKDKIKYFHNSKDCNNNRKYAGFLVGTEIVMPNGCDKADQNKDAEGARKDYERAVIRQQGNLCNERYRGEITSNAFRKQHKLGEYTQRK